MSERKNIKVNESEWNRTRVGFAGIAAGSLGTALVGLYAQIFGESTVATICMILFVCIFSVSGVLFVGGSND